MEDELHWFFRAFFEMRKGLILGLGTRREDIRDGTATSHVARIFPYPEFQGIVVEPSRPTLQLQPNVIIVGFAPLFTKPEAYRVSGKKPLAVGKQKLGERLDDIYAQSCFLCRGSKNRILVNTITGETYRPRLDDTRVQVDYGVIRRRFRGATQNTIILDGLHRLGTLGATKVVTDLGYLRAIWKALSMITDRDEALLVEILVRARHEKQPEARVYALDLIDAEPLALVYNRQWYYDLVNGGEWRDQLPWAIQLFMQGDEPARPAQESEIEQRIPRVEFEADLRGFDSRMRGICRAAFTDGHGSRNGARNGDVPDVLAWLTGSSDRFCIRLVEWAPWGRIVKTCELPKNAHSAIRRVRKQFLVHLALCRALGFEFACCDASIRRLFPEFTSGARDKSLARRFICAVPGKLREGFEGLLGQARQSKDHLHAEYSRVNKSYALKLDRSALVVKLRV